MTRLYPSGWKQSIAGLGSSLPPSSPQLAWPLWLCSEKLASCLPLRKKVWESQGTVGVTTFPILADLRFKHHLIKTPLPKSTLSAVSCVQELC